jgi:signal transduction histidine kinase
MDGFTPFASREAPDSSIQQALGEILGVDHFNKAFEFFLGSKMEWDNLLEGKTDKGDVFIFGFEDGEYTVLTIESDSRLVKLEGAVKELVLKGYFNERSVEQHLENLLAEEGIFIGKIGPGVNSLSGSAEDILRALTPDSQVQLFSKILAMQDNVESRIEAINLKSNDCRSYSARILIDGEVTHLIISDITPSVERDEFKNKLETSEEAMRLVMHFLRLISHDLKTPLSVISTYIYLASANQSNKERIDRYLKIIQQNADVMSEEISKLIDLARMIFNFEEFPVKVVSVNDVMVEIHNYVRNTAIPYVKGDGKPIDFKLVDLNYNESFKLEIKPLFFHAIQNIINNAIKYSPSGTIEIRSGFLYDPESPNGDQVFAIEILDEGIGIPPYEIDKVFMINERGSNTGDIEGHGTGLALAQYIVKSLGGDIYAENREDGGMKFTIVLPFTNLAEGYENLEA